jgi:hypothetical protein
MWIEIRLSSLQGAPWRYIKMHRAGLEPATQ